MVHFVIFHVECKAIFTDSRINSYSDLMLPYTTRPEETLLNE
jgi:hypothetical protein